MVDCTLILSDVIAHRQPDLAARRDSTPLLTFEFEIHMHEKHTKARERERLQHDYQHLTTRKETKTRDKSTYPEHIIQASLLSILHCSAASALSSARRLASSYEISSSSDGPGDSGRLAPDFETETEGDGTGAAEAVVAMETCLSGATSDSAEGAATGVLAAVAVILAAAALSLASAIVSDCKCHCKGR